MGPLSSFNLSLVDLRCRIGSSRHQSEEELRRGHPASGDPALQLTPDNPSTALYTTECSPRSNADLTVAIALHILLGAEKFRIKIGRRARSMKVHIVRAE